MNAGKFSLTELKRLVADGQRRDLMDAKEYIQKYFYPLSNGMILFVTRGEKKLLTMDAFKTAWAARFGAELYKWFLKETVNVYDISISTSAPFIDDDKLNTFAGFKHTQDKKFKKCSKPAKEGCQMMLDFIFQVWCSSDQTSYEYILNWISNMVKGNKNNTILYLKSYVEGIGKSTVTQFIMNYVLGKNICIESNSDPLKTPYNEILAGKLMVVFEELECSGERDWSVMSTKLKRWSTSNEITYAEKYIKAYESRNINNYVICTNVEAIKASEGRRYYILDLSTKYKNNHSFFNNLYDMCFNDDVGQAFYLYMMERDTTKFNPQNFVETQAKKIAQSDRLHSLFKFIKFNYILPGHDLKATTKELYEDYLKYCALINSTQTLSKHKIIALLREHEIEYKTSNGKMTYTFTNEELRAVGNKFKWFYDGDDEDMEDNRIMKVSNAVKLVMTPNEIKLMEENERLKKIIAELRSPQERLPQEQNTQKTVEKIVEVDEGPMRYFTPDKVVEKSVEVKALEDIFSVALGSVKKSKSKVKTV